MRKNFAGLKNIICFIFCLAGIFQARAQTYNFNHYSVKDGLIQSNVYDILQDRNGYIWLATDGGLSKFDGRNFTNYSTYDGLSETAVNAICEDNEGNIWIGHTLGKITVFDGKSFKPFPLKTKEKVNRISDIRLDEKNNLWVATVGSGALYIDTKTKAIRVFSIDEGLDNNIYSIYQDRAKATWFVTEIGIKSKPAGSDSITFFKPAGFPFYVYSCMAEDNEGNLLFGTYSNGLVKYDLRTKKSVTLGIEKGLNSNFITSVLQDKYGTIWLGTWEGGICFIKGEKISTMGIANGMPGNKVRSLFIDREGILWVGLQDRGIAEFKGFRFVHYGVAEGLKNGVVNAITRDVFGRYWYGTNEGITIYDSAAIKNKRFINIDPSFDLRNNLITSLAQYNDKIYASTFKGDIGIYNAKSLRLESTISINQTFINDLNVVGDLLWISYSSGVTTYNLKTHEFKDVRALDHKIVVKTYAAKDGTIWIGNRESGLMCLKENKLIRYNERDGFTHNSPTSFCEDDEGNLWIGTEGGGLFKKQGHAFVHYTVKQGLLSDFITLVANDRNGKLLIGTNIGLSKFNIADNKFINYTSYEGFTAIETKLNSYYVEKNGSMWLGTINGVTYYNTAIDAEKKQPPILYLNGYDIFATSYPLTDNPSLSYNQNDITFKFTGLNYLNPQKIVYRYKLEGFDEVWKQATGIDNVSYTHLPPGDFTFMLTSCSSEGICSSDPISYSFSIIPPIYKRGWFIVTMVILLIVGLWSYIFFRTRYLRRAKLILENLVKARTLEIEEKNNTLVEANQTISTKNKEITDSINYAKRIQEAILPSANQFNALFKNSFILYNPKDIVSGDFYWYTDILAKSKIAQTGEHDILIAVADCTGHGVPGAFMCMIGSSLLNQIVQENIELKPNNILDQLHIGIRESLKQRETETRDGMDIALCHVNRAKKQLEFSGALRPLLLFRGETYKQKFAPAHQGILMEEIKADKFPIGGLQSEDKREFTNKTIDYYEGDSIYLFTDGFADQFGGARGKKLMTKKFKEIISSIQNKTMDEQLEYLENFMNEWRKGYEQVDDILVVGIRF